MLVTQLFLNGLSFETENTAERSKEAPLSHTPEQRLFLLPQILLAAGKHRNGALPTPSGMECELKSR